MDKIINVAEEFTPYPGGRYRTDGEFSGERFREDFLMPAFRDKKFDRIVVDLDGTEGFGSSFLEEAFGGLVRAGFSPEDVKRRIEILSERPSYIKNIAFYISQAAPKQ